MKDPSLPLESEIALPKVSATGVAVCEMTKDSEWVKRDHFFPHAFAHSQGRLFFCKSNTCDFGQFLAMTSVARFGCFIRTLYIRKSG